MTRIKAVLFDMIGTTVTSTDPDFIINCFKSAFLAYKIPVNDTIIKDNRGKDKRTMIREALTKQEASLELIEPIYKSFKKSLASGLANFVEQEHVPDLVSFLRNKNIQIGIGTGLSKSLFVDIYDHLGWEKYNFDYAGVSETIGKSRPDPAMIFDLMNKLKIDSPRAIIKIGDTVADIQEGKNAGVHTAVVLAGTQEEETLRKASPDYVLDTLIDVKKINLLK